MLQALTLGGALISWWDYGRSSLGIYLALNAVAVFELACEVWRSNQLKDRRNAPDL